MTIFTAAKNHSILHMHAIVMKLACMLTEVLIFFGTEQRNRNKTTSITQRRHLTKLYDRIFRLHDAYLTWFSERVINMFSISDVVS